MSIREKAILSAKRYLPKGARDWVVRQQRRYNLHWVRVGKVNFGDLLRTTPVSPIFGIDRGFPIERYYIEKFLNRHRGDVRGRCLEMGDATYINKFGDDRVTQIDVMHVVAGNPAATIVADLTSASHVPSDTFDCIIFTQSLQMIYDMHAALQHLHRILKPGGVLLLTSHGISKIGRRLGRDGWGEYWRITTQSAERLFSDTFPGADIDVGSYGNVLTSCCCLHGIVAEEVSSEDLDINDPDFEVIVTIRARKGGPGKEYPKEIKPGSDKERQENRDE
jgi:SAM-dependent methyltransferase